MVGKAKPAAALVSSKRVKYMMLPGLLRTQFVPTRAPLTIRMETLRHDSGVRLAGTIVMFMFDPRTVTVLV